MALPATEMRWCVSYQASPRALALANRHYSRVTPGSRQSFVPPGRRVILLTEHADALWVTSWPYPEYIRRAYFKTAWFCTLFRNESPYLSSDLIRQAVASTRWYWNQIPDDGMITMIDPSKIRRKRDPGRCFRKAGFKDAGYTPGGLLIMQMPKVEIPCMQAPISAQLELWGEA